jgi:microcystin degradation protein MlrC
MVRLAVARLRFCSNSFTPRRTRSEDVQAHEWSTGNRAIAEAAGSGNELDGVAEFANRNADWSITLLRSAAATTGGPLASNLFTSWLAEVETALARGRYDALYIALHGACQAEGDPAADLTVLRRMRGVMGPRPIVASFDVRANLSEEVALLLDGATANRRGEAGSEAGAATRALGLLSRILSGEVRPVGALARLPMVSVGADIDDAVDAALADARTRMKPPVIEAALFTGYAWSDSPFTGPSALVWADRDAGAAREEAARLAIQLGNAAPRPPCETLAVDAAIKRAAASPASDAPALLLDAADDPIEGGLLDTPDMLRGLQRAQAFGHLPGRVLIAAFHDPAAVQTAKAGGVGAAFSANVGARTTAQFGAGVPMAGEVAAIGHCAAAWDFAVVRSGQIDILFVGRRPGQITPALLEACGVDKSAFAVLAIKGGHAAGAAFVGQTGEGMFVDCVGPSNLDLMRLPYNFVPANRRLLEEDVDIAADTEQGAGKRGSPTDRRANVRH